MKPIHSLGLAVALAVAAGGAGAQSTSMTPPGAQLAVGESAILPFHLPYKGSIPVRVTVTSIEPGTMAEFQAAGYKVPPDAADRKPYYVSYTVTALADGELSGSSLGMLYGVDDRNDERSETLTMSNFSGARFDRCKQSTFKAGAGNGTTYASCKIYLVQNSGAITGLRFKGGGDENAAYFRSPVVWKTTNVASAQNPSGAGTLLPGH